MESTIVRSVLENDLYKFSMSYYYQRTTPEGIGTFSFNDRNGMKFTPEFVDLLRKEFKKLETLALTDEEFKWCLSNIYFIPQCYFEWLKGFRFNADIIDISLDEEGHLHIEAKDLIYKVTLYEIPILSTVSEVYYKIYEKTEPDWAYIDSHLEKKVAISNENKLKCCMIYGYLVAMPVKKCVQTWRIWHETVNIFLMVLFIGLCNFLLFTFMFHYPLRLDLCVTFVYWTFIIGFFISVLSTFMSYQRYLRGQLNDLLDKTTDKQTGIQVTIHDTRVRGNDVTLPINDLLYIEAQKNNVVVGYVKDGKLRKDELQTSLTAVLNDLGEYDNIFQCHRSFVVNLNNLSGTL